MAHERYFSPFRPNGIVYALSGAIAQSKAVSYGSKKIDCHKRVISTGFSQGTIDPNETRPCPPGLFPDHRHIPRRLRSTFRRAYLHARANRYSHTYAFPLRNPYHAANHHTQTHPR